MITAHNHSYHVSNGNNKMKLKKFSRPLANEFCDEWQWNRNDKSDAVRISETNGKIAYFHIGWSNGTAAVRATKPINIYNQSKYYWEILIKDKVFGTSMMVGLTTQQARIHSNSYLNLIGENRFGWGLSHKGLLWYNGKWKEYTKPFRENSSTLIGCLFDGKNGTLTYYKDGECLGVAFSGLNLVNDNLYPTICSTAAQSQFILTFARREYFNLQDRCRDVIRRTHCLQCEDKWNQLLPERILSYLNFEEFCEAKRKDHFHCNEVKEEKPSLVVQIKSSESSKI